MKPLDSATRYAQGVVAGEIPAGPYVRGACQRHLNDLEQGPERGLRWDVEAGDRVAAFFKGVLRLNGGDFEGVAFEPLPWQDFVLRSIFGWKNSEGTRRFRMAFILTGKGSGKSPLAGGVGLYMLTADGENRAEVYAAASKKDQAQIMFRDAVAMRDQSPLLRDRLRASGGKGKEWNLAYEKTGSFFRTIASEDGQSGPRPHCALLDEVHEHRDNTIVEMMRAGTKGRKQALIFAITNAEADRTSVCANYREYSERVCNGTLQDDSFFAYVAALDPDDDPFADESCWAKANPSLGRTFSDKYLREQVTQARGMPSKEAIVRRLNFCQPTDAAAPWIDNDMWFACQSEFDPADLRGLPCYLGLDLSLKRDLTAAAAVWRHPDDTLSAAVWFWTPGDTLDERARTDNVPYRTWVSQGFLQAPPGRLIDRQAVALFVQQFSAAHDVRALAFDQWQIDDFLSACDAIGMDAWIDDQRGAQPGSGLRMLRHGQGHAGGLSETSLWMPRSITALEDAIVQGNVRIRSSPVLTWNSASAVVLADATGNRKWDKRKATGRIDGIVALTQAVGAAAVQEPPAAKSFWQVDDL